MSPAPLPAARRDTKAIVRKKSALCLLRLYRKYPEIFSPEAIVEPILELLGGAWRPCGRWGRRCWVMLFPPTLS